MEKKYKLAREEGNWNRLVALRSFGDVKEGDLGGLVESEENLSHEGDCWIYDEAVSFQRARVIGNAKVRGYAFICGNAIVGGNAKVSEYAMIDGTSKVYRNKYSGRTTINA